MSVQTLSQNGVTLYIENGIAILRYFGGKFPLGVGLDKVLDLAPGHERTFGGCQVTGYLNDVLFVLPDKTIATFRRADLTIFANQ